MSKQGDDEPIRFYSSKTAYAEFSNFSPHGFEIDGRYWPTVEHYFQAQKFPDHPDYQERIRQATTPKQAKSLGRTREVPIRLDWERVKEEVMRRALQAKFGSHAELRGILIETADRPLIEDAPTDSYWGSGRAGTGKNRLGVLLMELRAALRSAAPRSEKVKMLAGELHDPHVDELTLLRKQARELTRRLNATGVDEELERARLIQALLGSVGQDTWIEPPFFCDYGFNITVGDRVFFNFNCVVLDSGLVRIGDNVQIGPAVQLYTVNHPLNAAERRARLEFARPIEIGSDAWIGGGAVLCPGVRIGERAVIGAGSVVTRDIPADVLAVGNPCRVIRALG